MIEKQRIKMQFFNSKGINYREWMKNCFGKDYRSQKIESSADKLFCKNSSEKRTLFDSKYSNDRYETYFDKKNLLFIPLKIQSSNMDKMFYDQNLLQDYKKMEGEIPLSLKVQMYLKLELKISAKKMFNSETLIFSRSWF